MAGSRDDKGSWDLVPVPLVSSGSQHWNIWLDFSTKFCQRNIRSGSSLQLGENIDNEGTSGGETAGGDDDFKQPGWLSSSSVGAEKDGEEIWSLTSLGSSDCVHCKIFHCLNCFFSQGTSRLTQFVHRGSWWSHWESRLDSYYKGRGNQTFRLLRIHPAHAPGVRLIMAA
ncbi:hypothetical protein BJY01DRAFT_228866 [Aspergillus pseudoustus]|uniref:Uncharacterized protein n=1 Tax=Aspergillus pseudoustus TaxID=1810923 RepID=A0ABR4IJA5_9EURO